MSFARERERTGKVFFSGLNSESRGRTRSVDYWEKVEINSLSYSQMAVADTDLCQSAVDESARQVPYLATTQTTGNVRPSANQRTGTETLSIGDTATGDVSAISRYFAFLEWRQLKITNYDMMMILSSCFEEGQGHLRDW